jgi:hypothetical protein
VEYKDYMIRWLHTASWNIREAALLLSGIDPETCDYKPNDTGNSPTDIMHFWLKKQWNTGYLPLDENGRTTPGEIMRAVIAHNQVRPPALEKLWDAIRNGKNTGQVFAKASWTIYMRAKELIFAAYPEITKAQLARELSELPKYYQFPNGGLLASYSEATLLRKLRNTLPGKKAGHPKKTQSVDVDMLAIAKQIHPK